MNTIKFEINYSYEVREWDEDAEKWGSWETKSNRNPRTAEL
jgi:hypothetical protein